MPINLPDKIVNQSSGLKPIKIEEEFIGFRNPVTTDIAWGSSLSKISKNESENDELLETIKLQKDALRKSASSRSTVAAKTTLAASTLSTNFVGIDNAGASSPLDNTVAMSSGGLIVSFVNAVISYYSATGTVTYTNDIYTLVGSPSLTNHLCDPKVIYDNVADRFIFYVQVCDGISANSKVVMGFSITNDPAAGWWILHPP